MLPDRAMTAVAAPYRQVQVSPLANREHALETELRETREKLSAYANEEVRLSRELIEVRAQMAASGERKVVRPNGEIDAGRFQNKWFVIGCLLGAIFACSATGLVRTDTARDAPRGTTYEWGGPVAAGQTWLYVEDPRGLGTSVDGQPAGSSARLEVSATASHVVGFSGGKTAVVRSIPCTTAVVRFDPRAGEPRVERFFNSSTCI